MAHNSYTMCIRDLPDMYTFSPRASGVHIRQTTHAHGITITYRIPGNFRGMYISRIAVERRFSRIKFRGWGILPLKFLYLTHVFARQG